MGAITRIVSADGTKKRCTKCHKFKPIDDYYFKFCATTTDRLRNECRQCESRIELKRYYQKQRHA